MDDMVARLLEVTPAADEAEIQRRLALPPPPNRFPGQYAPSTDDVVDNHWNSAVINAKLAEVGSACLGVLSFCHAVILSFCHSVSVLVSAAGCEDVLSTDVSVGCRRTTGR